MSRRGILAIVIVLVIVVPAVGRMSGGLGFLKSRVEPPPAPREAVPSSPPKGAPSATRTDPTLPRSAPRAPRTPPRAAQKPAAAKFDEYYVSPGSVLAVKMQTPIGSASSAAGDQVDARLTTAVTRDRVELIPAGSVIRGIVVDAVAGSRATPRGRVSVTFSVIEHGRTGSRAALRTRPAIFDAVTDKKPTDVWLPAGTPLRVVLVEPLLVQIPK